MVAMDRLAEPGAKKVLLELARQVMGRTAQA
jgi:hypothetical protein